MEAKERVALRIHFFGIGRSINKQEMNGEESYSFDFKRWVLVKGKSVVIPYINNKRYYNLELLVYTLIRLNLIKA